MKDTYYQGSPEGGEVGCTSPWKKNFCKISKGDQKFTLSPLDFLRNSRENLKGVPKDIFGLNSGMFPLVPPLGLQ